MRFLFEICSRTLLICIFLHVMNVSSHHFVITTDVSTGFRVGCVSVNGLAEKASVFSRTLKFGNCCNKDISENTQERCASLDLNYTDSN